ncbi:DoxX family protein [Candidatus Nomurabacteria bacterium]|nr:DoxX family protein [Candidatus Nomurabacteria bacterium]
MMKKSCSCGDLGLLILRFGLAAVFLFHGVGKAMNMGDTIAFFQSVNLPAFLAWIVMIVEVLAGLAFTFGVFVRYAAYGVVAIMLGSIFFVKMKLGFMAMEVDVLALTSAVALATLGAGKYSMAKHCKCGGHCMMCKSDNCCGSSCSHDKGGAPAQDMPKEEPSMTTENMSSGM